MVERRPWVCFSYSVAVAFGDGVGRGGGGGGGKEFFGPPDRLVLLQRKASMVVWGGDRICSLQLGLVGGPPEPRP